MFDVVIYLATTVTYSCTIYILTFSTVSTVRYCIYNQHRHTSIFQSKTFYISKPEFPSKGKRKNKQTPRSHLYPRSPISTYQAVIILSLYPNIVSCICHRKIYPYISVDGKDRAHPWNPYNNSFVGFALYPPSRILLLYHTFRNLTGKMLQRSVQVVRICNLCNLCNEAQGLVLLQPRNLCLC